MCVNKKLLFVLLLFFSNNISGADYFNWNFAVSCPLSIIPYTSSLLGCIARYKEGAYCAASIRLCGFVGFVGVTILLLETTFKLKKKIVRKSLFIRTVCYVGLFIGSLIYIIELILLCKEGKVTIYRILQW